MVVLDEAYFEFVKSRTTRTPDADNDYPNLWCSDLFQMYGLAGCGWAIWSGPPEVGRHPQDLHRLIGQRRGAAAPGPPSRTRSTSAGPERVEEGKRYLTRS